MVKETSIPAGYMKTDMGVIPVDWNVMKFEDVMTGFSSGQTPSRNRPEYYKGNIKWITSGELNYNVIADTIEKITLEAVEKTNLKILPKGTFLMAITGLEAEGTRGRCGIVGTEATTNQSCMALFPKRKLLTEYLFHYYVYYGNSLAFKYCQGTKQQSYTGEIVKILPIILPPTIEEQKAIASTLSDVDALIAALEQLITKKRNIKQGAMQQLLTGKKRLPGFSGEWGEINIAENSVLKARIGWQGLTTAEYLENGDYYLVTGTDFVDGKINWSSCHFVDKNRYVQDKNIQLSNDDVLITKDGTIGKVGYVDNLPGKATLNSGVFVIRPRDKSYFPLFFYYVLKSSIFETFMKQLQAGSTISHLYQKDFVNFSFSAPSHDEQLAIAQILSDMDAEIEALEQKRDKHKALKQGMMQELLTGKTRLV